MKKLPVALQVYSIREEAEIDFAKAMQQVKKMGYDGVELAGLYGNSPEKIKECLKELGLTPISAHVPYEEFLKDLEGTVQRYAIIGCKYVAIPFLSEEYRYGTENYIKVLENIQNIAKECHKERITLLYHNHDFEFEKDKEGEYVLDSMYQRISKKDLQTELDTCWVKFAGVEPAGYIRKYDGRCPIIHLKDFVKEPSFDYRALGYGIQDISAILEAAVASGCEWIVVEQDEHSKNKPMEDTELSRNYLKTLGW
jgi:sugar phosphate isomerase/epimerase